MKIIQGIENLYNDVVILDLVDVEAATRGDVIYDMVAVSKSIIALYNNRETALMRKDSEKIELYENELVQTIESIRRYTNYKETRDALR